MGKISFTLILLLCSAATCFAGDGSKDNPYSFKEFMSIINSSAGNNAYNKWICSYMGIYKAYSTVISTGGVKTEEHKMLILTEKPGVIYSSRQPSQYTSSSFIMVYGDRFFEENPTIANALINNKSIKMLAHCSSHWKHAQGYYVVEVEEYRIDDTNEMSGTCGDKVTWTFSEETKTLTISGTGNMWDYSDSYFSHSIFTPWGDFIQNIKNVVIEDGVTSIGVCAFYGCINIEKIDIPNSITSIGRYALMNCRALSQIKLPSNLVSIGDQAFYGCSSLPSVIIPKTVTSIENDMLFGNCTSLTSIVVEEGNQAYDSRKNCNAIIVTSFNILIQGCNVTKIPDGITEISRTAFCQSGIKSIAIPNSVKKISYEAFNGCQELTTVVVGDGVSEIGDEFTGLGRSFGSCSKLKDFYLYATNVPLTKDNTFKDTNIGNAVLHVPANLLETYKIISPWSGFKEIIALTESDPKPTHSNGDTEGNQKYVDMGLQSGNLWAACNIGANSPEEYGEYYAWAESSSKDFYDWSTYKYCNGSNITLNKYCFSDTFGVVDNKYILDAEDDVATLNFGKLWKLPSEEDAKELFYSCKWKMGMLNSVPGCYVTGPNGNSIFFPLAGYKEGGALIEEGQSFYLFLSTLYRDNEDHPDFGNYMFCNGTQYGWGGAERCYGLSARAITNPKFKGDDTSGGHEYVDLGLPSGLKWATMNVGADKPEDIGLYFAWGETQGYTFKTSDGHIFDWRSYKWSVDSYRNITKYNPLGKVDNKTVLDLEDDAAYVNWGGNWRMPTKEEYEELMDNTTWKVTTTGLTFTSKINGNSIYMPFGGYRESWNIKQMELGYYWSSTLDKFAGNACAINFFANPGLNFFYRCYGLPVRPVFTGSSVGINSINKSEGGNDLWFDMSGRRLMSKPNKKGLYIRGGKKVVIK